MQIEVGDKPYWVPFSIAAFSTDLSKHWLDFASVMVVLAVLGGWVIHRTLNRPLQQLSAAVNQIGAGQRTTPIKEGINGVSKSMGSVSLILKSISA